MALALKEFFTSFHLGITLVLNLEPRRLLWLRDVRPKAMLGHDSFQVHLADMLEQRRPVLGHMFDVSHSGCRNLGQKTPEFVLSVCQSLRPQILAVTHQQVERKEAGFAPMKEQVTELRSTPPVEADNLSVEHSLALIGRNDCLPKFCERIERMTVAGDEFGATAMDDSE